MTEPATDNATDTSPYYSQKVSLAGAIQEPSRQDHEYQGMVLNQTSTNMISNSSNKDNSQVNGAGDKNDEG